MSQTDPNFKYTEALRLLDAVILEQDSNAWVQSCVLLTDFLLCNFEGADCTPENATLCQKMLDSVCDPNSDIRKDVFTVPPNVTTSIWPIAIMTIVIRNLASHKLDHGFIMAQDFVKTPSYIEFTMKYCKVIFASVDQRPLNKNA